MSLRWKSELAIRLDAEGCEARLAPGVLRQRLAASVRARGDAAQALPAAMEQLRAAHPRALPPRATLTVPDERVYYALIPADGPWSERLQRAARHFAETLGRPDLLVQSSLVAAGRAWLAAAIEPEDRTAWEAACAAAGLELAHLHPALLQDLGRHAAALPDDALLALLRDEGAMLLSLRAGEIEALQWERCTPAELRQRVRAFARATARPDESERPVVLMHPARVPAERLERLLMQEGWQRLCIDEPAAEEAA